VPERRMAGFCTLNIRSGTIRIATKGVTFCGLCPLCHKGCASVRVTFQFGLYTLFIMSCYPKK
jgi:hypothetical protein